MIANNSVQPSGIVRDDEDEDLAGMHDDAQMGKHSDVAWVRSFRAFLGPKGEKGPSQAVQRSVGLKPEEVSRARNGHGSARVLILCSQAAGIAPPARLLQDSEMHRLLASFEQFRLEARRRFQESDRRREVEGLIRRFELRVEHALEEWREEGPD